MLQRLARRHNAQPRAVPDPAADRPTFPQRGLVPRPDDDRTAVTDMLFSRLSEQDIAAVVARLEPGYQSMWDSASPTERRRVTLAFGLLYGVEGVLTKTGLSPATPPPEVHSMVHGWVTEIGGSYYLADMVVGALEQVNDPPAPGSRALDFSCSSGRVVRVLAAALPEISWHGCDPNAGAIAWMSEHAPSVNVLVTPPTPPLPYADGSFDLVFAISVWSHYSAASAITWLEEMHRIVAPGGHVLLTTHGLHSCVWFTNVPDPAIEHKLGPDWISRTADRLERDGHCFWDVFGDRGDWGVVDSDWGLAFFTPEWLLEKITPRWGVRSYRIGAAHSNQDVYVLERH